MNPFTYNNVGKRMKLKENDAASEKKIKKERRAFLKRAVYKAPSLIVLGSLAKPKYAAADTSIPEEPIW